MAMLESDDPRASVLGAACRVRWVDDPMRCSEVQNNRDFKRGQVPFVQRPGQEALAREVTVYVIAKARIGRPLRSPPATEIRFVAGDFDAARTECSHGL